MKYKAEFVGGLGDIILRCYSDGVYMRVAHLGQGDNATVVFWSENPYAREILEWCPARGHLKISNGPPHLRTHFDTRQQLGLEVVDETGSVPPWEAGGKLIWYCSPKESVEVAKLCSRPFILVSASAGMADRNLPIDELQWMAGAIVGAGLRAIYVGRSYKNGLPRKEIIPEVPGLDSVNMIDKLSVPAVLRLVRAARGVISCHSAVSMCSWQEDKPLLTMYPKRIEDRDVKGQTGYSGALHREKTVHCPFGSFSAKLWDRFLELCK